MTFPLKNKKVYIITPSCHGNGGWCGCESKNLSGERC